MPSSSAARLVLVLKVLPTVRSCAIIGFRVSHRVGRLSPLLGGLIKQATHICTGADIGYRADVGAGLRILHPTGVVIAHDAVIGARCTIHQGVTIGGDPAGAPHIGADVNLGPGARVLGPVHVDDGCRVGANAVVTRTVRGRGIKLLGVPARDAGPV